MGGRKYRTISDLRGASLIATCEGCGHQAQIDGGVLVLQIGCNRHLDSLRFRCTACGSREVRITLAQQRGPWEPAIKRDRL
jgi:hypothetical protein